MSRLLLSLTAAGTVYASVWIPATAARQRAIEQRHVIATVVGPGDTAVPDLGIRDFIVREDGVARELVRVSPAAAPSHLAFVIDTSAIIEPALIEIRAAVAAFSRRMAAVPNPASQALVTVGERPMRVVDFTTRGAAVAVAAEQLVYRRGSGAHLLDGIIETAQALKRAEATRPVIVAFSVALGQEFSTANWQRTEAVLRDAGVTLWTVELRGGNVSSGQDDIDRDTVVTDVARRSGGFSESVLSKEGLGLGFDRVATLLTSAYDITYGRPESLLPPTRIAVSTRNGSQRVLATEWAR
jgi:hypothetical protein